MSKDVGRRGFFKAFAGGVAASSVSDEPAVDPQPDMRTIMREELQRFLDAPLNVDANVVVTTGSECKEYDGGGNLIRVTELFDDGVAFTQKRREPREGET